MAAPSPQTKASQRPKLRFPLSLRWRNCLPSSSPPICRFGAGTGRRMGNFLSSKALTFTWSIRPVEAAQCSPSQDLRWIKSSRAGMDASSPLEHLAGLAAPKPISGASIPMGPTQCASLPASTSGCLPVQTTASGCITSTPPKTTSSNVFPLREAHPKQLSRLLPILTPFRRMAKSSPRSNCANRITRQFSFCVLLRPEKNPLLNLIPAGCRVWRSCLLEKGFFM